VTSPTPCSRCGGSGLRCVERESRPSGAINYDYFECPVCNGTGQQPQRKETE